MIVCVFDKHVQAKLVEKRVLSEFEISFIDLSPLKKVMIKLLHEKLQVDKDLKRRYK